MDKKLFQNDSPTISEFVGMAEKFGLTLHGYVVSPDRRDCRISVVGLEGKILVPGATFLLRQAAGS